MDDLREKVLRGLACLSNPFVQDADERDCEHCSYDSASCFLDITSDALSLLKAQQPRAMTLEEVWNRGDNEPLFLEYVLPSRAELCPAIFQPDNSDRGGGDGYMCVVGKWCASGFYNVREYNKTWRCWTSRPTDEQRKAVKWE